MNEARLLEGVPEWWMHNSKVIKKVGEEVLDRPTVKRPPGDMAVVKQHGAEGGESQERCKEMEGVWTASG